MDSVCRRVLCLAILNFSSLKSSYSQNLLLLVCFHSYILFLKRLYQLINDGGCFIHCWSEILNKWISDTRFPCCFKPVPSRIWCRNGNHSVTLCGLQYLTTHRDDPQYIYCCPTCSYRKKFQWIGKIKINTSVAADMKGDCHCPFQTYCLIIRLERGRKELTTPVTVSFSYLNFKPGTLRMQFTEVCCIHIAECIS